MKITKEQLKTMPLFLNQRTRALYFGKNFYVNGIKINIETNSIKEFRKFFNQSFMVAKNLDHKSILLLYMLFKKEYVVFKRKFVI